MATWGKQKHGMYVIGGWWCNGRAHHHKTEAAADLCDRKRAIKAARLIAEAEGEARP